MYENGRPNDSTPETQVQEASMSPPLPPIPVVSASEDDPIAKGLSTPARNPPGMKKTFAKIHYQYEVNIDPPEVDATVRREIMRYIGDNLKIEYKFKENSFFVFSPMNVTSDSDEYENSPGGLISENPNPLSFSVEGIKTTENWDSGKYSTNMKIHLKKRRRALEVVQGQDQPNHDEEIETCPNNFANFIEDNKFKLIAFGMVFALLVGLAVALIYPIDVAE